MTPPTATLGERLRRRRLDRGLTLSAVADASGVSKGFLSQLERGLSQASVATLARIAEAVGSTAAELLTQPRAVVRSDEGPAIQFGGSGTTDHLLTPVGLPGFQVLHAEVTSEGCSSYGHVADLGSHFIYVTGGQLTVTLDDVEHVIGAGQSFAFATPASYGWQNRSTETTRLLWVVSPPPLA